MQACDAHGNRRWTGGDRFSLEIRGVAADAVQVSAGRPAWASAMDPDELSHPCDCSAHTPHHEPLGSGGSRGSGAHCPSRSLTQGRHARDAAVRRVQVKDRGDGTYAVEYCIPIEGTYTLTVMLAGHHIRGSPMGLTVYRYVRLHSTDPVFIRPSAQLTLALNWTVSE